MVKEQERIRRVALTTQVISLLALAISVGAMIVAYTG